MSNKQTILQGLSNEENKHLLRLVAWACVWCVCGFKHGK